MRSKRKPAQASPTLGWAHVFGSLFLRLPLLVLGAFLAPGAPIPKTQPFPSPDKPALAGSLVLTCQVRLRIENLGLGALPWGSRILSSAWHWTPAPRGLRHLSSHGPTLCCPKELKDAWKAVKHSSRQQPTCPLSFSPTGRKISRNPDAWAEVNSQGDSWRKQSFWLSCLLVMKRNSLPKSSFIILLEYPLLSALQTPQPFLWALVPQALPCGWW